MPGPSPLTIDIARLGRRPGSMMTHVETVPSPERIGLDLMAIAAGAPIDLDLQLQSVSEGGTKCTDVAECLGLIADGEDIDYDGVSGPIEFDENGDPTEAFIGIYQYGADNTYTFLNAEQGSLNE